MPIYGGEDKAASKSKATVYLPSGKIDSKATAAAAAKLKPPAKDRSNPLFLYPSPGVEGVARDTIGATAVKRGYVRRLTEFYKRTSGSGTNAAAGTTLGNLKCNFQFNPETITRSIQSDTSMQFFFNQDPNQLTQPVPGQASFAFKLRFNREAELASGKYLAGNKLVKGKPAKNTSSALELANQIYIDKDYDPAWVTAIGVLADIMVLDDILGVGLSQDIVNAVQANALLMPPEKVTTVDPTDSTIKTETDVYDAKRMSEFTSNLGNKAFLVPQPIRVVFSDWMMIEGFVTSSQVDFQKYTRGFVPTVCEVYVTMQALYIGFTQDKTFLTAMTVDPSSTSGAEGSADPPAIGTPERDLYDQTKAGLTNFTYPAKFQQGSSGSHFLLDDFFQNAGRVKQISFEAALTPSGKVFARGASNTKNVGGGLTFKVSGKMSFWWAEHVTNGTNTRNTTKQNAGGSTLTYALGPPANTSEWNQFGTKENPFVITTDHNVAGLAGPGAGNNDPSTLFLGKDMEGNELKTANWRWELNQTIAKLPFKEDRFYGEIELTVHCTRTGLSEITLPQKYVGKLLGTNANGKRGIAIGINPVLSLSTHLTPTPL